MKRFAIFFITAILLFSALVFPASAFEPYINPEISISFSKDSSPTIDGKISYNEYGLSPTLSYSDANDKPQFTTPDDHDQFDDWDFDFYATADEDFLYLAWSVNSFVFQPFDRDAVAPDWRYTTDDSYLGNMWKFSNVQFIITRGAPQAGVTDYDKNCLEVGFCQFEDGTVGKYAYRIPDGYTKSSLSLNSWSAAVVNDGFMTTTYEIAIPWWATGVSSVEENLQFGLAFSVSAQNDYNEKKGMIEWTDSVLKPRDTDNAGVVTLVNSKTLPDGMAPIEALRAIRFDIDKVNSPLDAEEIALQTNPYHPINSNWAYALLLEPIDGSETAYRLIAKQHGIGYEILFDEYKEGMLVLAIHSNGLSENDPQYYEGFAEKQAAMDLPLGSELTLWGVDIYAGEKIYSNAMMYVTKAPVVMDESSAESSEEESLPISTPEENTASKSPDNNKFENNDDLDVAESDSKGGFSVLGIILIIVAIIVVLILLCLPFVFIIAIILIIVLVLRKKKKKNAEASKITNNADTDNTSTDKK